MRDINISPCRWHLRIWDVDNNEWLCEHDDDALPYYGFDIRGGEVTAIQGMRGVCNAFAHGKEFIWEQSTGLKDKNGKEIYEGDILWWEHFYEMTGESIETTAKVYWEETNSSFVVGDWFELLGHLVDEDEIYIIGNIHENPELLGEEK